MDSYAAKRVRQARGAHELERGVDTIREVLAHLIGDLASVDDRQIDPSLFQHVETVRPPSSRQDGRTQLLGERGRGKSDRGGATTDEESLAGLQVESDRQRTVRRLNHLRQSADDLPRQLSAHRYDLGQRNRGVFGVAAVVGPAHLAHHRHDLLAWFEATSG